jgi:hypothetical protein
VSVHINVEAIMNRLGAIKAKLPDAMLVAVQAIVADAVRYAVTEELLGQKLHRRSGTLIRDVTASPSVEPPRIDTPSQITGTIGTSLGYGKAHELGFIGTVNVREHTRRKVAVRRNSRGMVEAKSRRRLRLLHGSGNYAYVRGHKMRMNIRAKYYLRDAVKAVEPKLLDYGLHALKILGRTGNVPKLAELRRGDSA